MPKQDKHMNKIETGVNDLATLHPELLTCWDYEKNSLSPCLIGVRYEKPVWWKCPKGHTQKIQIKSKIRQKECPFCSGKMIWSGDNDLATLHPELMSEWDFDRNTIEPHKISPNTYKKAFWICSNGHHWEAAIISRSHGGRCPICSNKKIVPGINDLATLNPQLMEEWDYEKNIGIDPTGLSANSEKSVWWKCKRAGHSWKTMIQTRNQGCGCPICAKEYKTSIPEQAIYYYCKKHFNDTINGYHPEWLGKQEIDVYIPTLHIGIEYDGRAWHKNYQKDRKKDQLCAEHDIRLIRVREPGLAPINEHSIILDSLKGEALQSGIFALLALLGVISPDINIARDKDDILSLMYYGEKCESLSRLFPHIAKEWDFESNGKYLTPGTINAKSAKKVFWICPNGHRYLARVDHRTIMGSGCPYCSGKKIGEGINDLQSLYPDIASEWDFSKNIITPNKVHYGSNKVFSWICPNGHHYEARVAQRTKIKLGCPYCSHHKLLKGSNDFATLHPELAKEWDYEKNIISPSQVAKSYRQTVWWKCPNGHHYQASVKQRVQYHKNCPYCLSFASQAPNLLEEWDYEQNHERPEDVTFGSGKKYCWVCPNGHHYKASPSSRKKTGCPICANRQVLKGYNDLESKYPAIAKEWDFEINNFMPSEIVFGSNKIVGWICPNGHHYQAMIRHRTLEGTGCRICARKRKHVKSGINDFATKCPELVREWDMDRNTETPDKVSAGTTQKFWWICPKGHHYQASASSRSHCHSGCPICANQQVLKGYNDLESQYPNIAAEWDYEKNGKLPSEVVKGSNKIFWWVCPQGHHYQASCNHRISGRGNCPFCGRKRKK